MSIDTSLFDYDVGYYELQPNFWLAGKSVPGNMIGCLSRKAAEAAVKAELRDTDIFFGTYMKTGVMLSVSVTHS